MMLLICFKSARGSHRWWLLHYRWPETLIVGSCLRSSNSSKAGCNSILFDGLWRVFLKCSHNKTCNHLHVWQKNRHSRHSSNITKHGMQRSLFYGMQRS